MARKELEEVREAGAKGVQRLFPGGEAPPKGKALESMVRSPPWERRLFMWLSKWLTDQSQVCSGNRMGLGDGALEESGLCSGVPTRRHPRHPPKP